VPDKYESFWQWFAEHEFEFFTFDPDNETEREPLFDRLTGKLKEIDSDLSFEFGPPSAKREFVVSASGIRRAFSEVQSLINAVPLLERWIVIAFRPRRLLPEVIVLGHQQISPNTITFTLLDNGKIAGLRLFIPGYRQNNPVLKQLGYLILDSVLGEYDVETRLGLIEMHSADSKIAGERYPISQLEGSFDSLVARLEGRTLKPS